MKRVSHYALLALSLLTLAIASSTPAIAEESVEEDIAPIAAMPSEASESTMEPEAQDVGAIEDEPQPHSEPAVETVQPVSDSQPSVIVEPVILPPATKKGIVIDHSAEHSCRSYDFTVDISWSHAERRKLSLSRTDSADYELKIFGMPKGIKVAFSKTAGSSYAPLAGEASVDLDINGSLSSQKGSFSVPIVFTKIDGDTRSSALCQINIINR